MDTKKKFRLIGAASAACAGFTASAACAAAAAPAAKGRPNVILIYVDDMGFSDVSAYGGQFAPTPNIDRIGKEGIQFMQYYTACPISSPSRVGVTTGMYPTQWGITTFLNDRRANYRNMSNDYLSSDAPSLARSMKESGYATGHFGKWHMGGGRDVKTPPQISEYGFDEWNSTWESPDPDPILTASNWIWSDKDSVKRWDRTAYFVDKTLDFLARNKEKGVPCYVNLWPDDMHTPYVPSQDVYKMGNSEWEKKVNFIPVLAELDKQIGRLLDGLDKLGIADNTIVIFTSDNGPNPSYKNGRTDGMRGQKATLYEGGIRMPFMIRWPARISAGQVNDETVLCSVDIFPTVCSITKSSHVLNGYTLDGKDMTKVWLGKSHEKRKSALYWEFGRHFVGKDKPKNAFQTRSPNVCMRDGDWKVIVNYDGTDLELYNLKLDRFETENLADKYPEIAKVMAEKAIKWFDYAFRRCAPEISEPVSASKSEAPIDSGYLETLILG